MGIMAIFTFYMAVRTAIVGSGVLVEPMYAAGGGDIMFEISGSGVGVARKCRLYVFPRPTGGVAVVA